MSTPAPFPPPNVLADALKRLPPKLRCMQIRATCPKSINPLERVRDIINSRHGSIKGMLAEEDAQLGHSTIVVVFLPASLDSATEILTELTQIGEIALD